MKPQAIKDKYLLWGLGLTGFLAFDLICWVLTSDWFWHGVAFCALCLLIGAIPLLVVIAFIIQCRRS